MARTAGNLLPPASSTSLLPLATSLCHQPLPPASEPLPPASATSLAPRGTRTAYTADTAPHAPPPLRRPQQLALKKTNLLYYLRIPLTITLAQQD